MADQIRIKIKESLKTCLANLPSGKTLKELAVPAEIMIRQVTTLIRPIEESKEEADPDITFWMDKLTVVIKERA